MGYVVAGTFVMLFFFMLFSKEDEITEESIEKEFGRMVVVPCECGGPTKTAMDDFFIEWYYCGWCKSGLDSYLEKPLDMTDFTRAFPSKGQSQ